MSDYERLAEKGLERIAMAKAALSAWVPFFGFLTLKLRPRAAGPGDRVSTICVTPDGTLVFNPHFVESHDDPQLRYILCHEVLHPALFYFERLEAWPQIVVGPGGPTRAFNLGHDYAINREIDEFITNCNRSADIRRPPDGLFDDEGTFRNWSAEEITAHLLANVKTIEIPSFGGQAAEGDDGERPNDGNNYGGDCREDLSGTKEGQRASRGDKSAQEQLAQEWKISLVAAAKVQEQSGKGNLPGGIQLLVDEIVDPKVDWLTALSMWMGENGRMVDYTYRRPSRRSVSVGEYMPSLTNHGVDKVVVLWDTSGSMYGREREILPEVDAICQDLGVKIEVIFCDTIIQDRVDNVESAYEIIDRIKGGGGSDFCPAFEAMAEENYQGIVVVFSDGYIDVPATKPPLIRDVLWVLFDRDVDPTDGRWGQTLRVDADGNIL